MVNEFVPGRGPSHPSVLIRRHLGIDDEPSLIGTPLMDVKASWQDFDAKGTLRTVADLPLARSLMGMTTEGEDRLAAKVRKALDRA